MLAFDEGMFMIGPDDVDDDGIDINDVKMQEVRDDDHSDVETRESRHGE